MADCWIRPITPTVLTESLRVADLTSPITNDSLQKCLSVEARRASEITRQLVSMGFLRELKPNSFTMTDEGLRLVEAVARKDQDRIHQILLKYEPYKRIYRLLEEKALSLEETASASSMNEVAVETILRLLEWSTGRLKRSRKRRFYITKRVPPALEAYLETLRKVWHDLNSTEFGVRREFIRIPDLRDAVCEALLMDAASFDNLLTKMLQSFPSHFELSSAPAPVTCASKEDGISIAGKRFFYVRMLEWR